MGYLNDDIEDFNKYKKNSLYSAGHFYSPIIDIDDIKNRENEIWRNEIPTEITGIDLNCDTQFYFISEFEKFYDQIKFPIQKSDASRYYYENDYYSYTDAIILYSFIRKFKPQNIIEIGSGYSSALMLDTRDLLGYSINLTFIDPDTSRIVSLITENDRQTNRIIDKPVQEVPIYEFRKLKENDILFIDSSHVIKTGNDLAFLLFEVIPNLNKGVLIHFHDVFYPFEYPKDWVYMGRNWNEDYVLRAFLLNNDAFEIKFFSHFLHLMHSEKFKNMPLCYKNFGGNLWLQKIK